VFTLNVNYLQLNSFQSIILHSILFNYGSVHICENSNKVHRVTIKSTTTVGLEVGLKPTTRSIGSNISHSCCWFPEILLPSRILRCFCWRLLILTRLCGALLEYPPYQPFLALFCLIQVSCHAWCLIHVAPPFDSIKQSKVWIPQTTMCPLFCSRTVIVIHAIIIRDCN